MTIVYPNGHLGIRSNPASADALPIPSDNPAAGAVSPEVYGSSLEYQSIDEILVSLQNHTAEVIPNSEAEYRLELDALLAHDRRFSSENQGIFPIRASRRCPRRTVSEALRKSRHIRRQINRGVIAPHRPREAVQGRLGRRERDAAEDADEQARPMTRRRQA